MTTQSTATILPFPRRRPPLVVDNDTSTNLFNAEISIASLSHEFDIEAENVRHGARLSQNGGIINGRALAWACHAALHIINLRGNLHTDHALSHAIRTWLQARRQADG
ncbi:MULTISPECIES: hypothetical protein [Rhizobium/Agrobacterium group]|uniref:Uncharacterized protein n=1 Tax=Allorhizobium ampelinum (strain ATCC BAA-846 / DSM 112012 / S4) TaxID=311402 RepID=B9K2Q4_ALLAM|nr:MULTISPECIES: hypothetical protein [Rhizobium/Agrobacterium group]ACM39152.1 hypothetical protein Avi_6157 [Allorhizobium ampelinum S4]MUO30815.1 hypothetical protein [Agrobacterium vitis]